MMNLRQPLVILANRPLRVIVHARFSTDEQRQTSLDDQIAVCRQFLDQGLPKGWSPTQVEVRDIREPEISGEIADRPGINEVWTAIESKRVDLIVAEESSRLYRHPTKAGELFEAAVDAGVRIICLSDYIDTADEDWPDRLHFAQSHHSRANFYTRRRISRAHDGLWARGAAVGNTVIGYRRRPTTPATETEPAKGPFYDEIDPEKAPIIREVFERIANGEPAWVVADWLTSIDFPKAKWARRNEWVDYNVNAIIRRPIYRGEERFREKVSKRQLRTGKSKIEWNDPDKVQTRKSEHLRMVPDWLWYKANEVVDSRRVFKEWYRGELHPLHGTSRDRHKLLSKVFVCGICGGPMHSHGRHNGSYRCANASRGKCWNRLYCDRDRTHLAIVKAVVDAVLSLEGMQDAILARARELHESGGKHEAELRRLEVRERKLRSQIEHLGHAVEHSGGEIASLVKRLAERERDLVVVLSKRDDLVANSRKDTLLPSKPELLAHLEKVKAGLLADEKRAAVMLRQMLAGSIRFMPYRRLCSTRVVPRAEFEIRLAAALPGKAADIGDGDGGNGGSDDAAVLGLRRSLCVDLFEQPLLVRHAVKAFQMREEGITYVEIGKALGISKFRVEGCIRLGKMIVEQGEVEPYKRLTEKPADAPRLNRRWARDQRNPRRRAS
jgi:DNA invertase Pin-like site-specific DNA recombinase/DNA-binding transcriptional MerR regulator